MPVRFGGIPQQLIPVFLILLVITAVFVVGRILFVPESFGELGHYRALAIDENAAKEIHYAGYQVCIDCHDDVYEEKAASNHRSLSCEVCHGPAADHAEDPGETLPVIPRGRDRCTLCHGYDQARPTGFPQIIPDQHNPGKPCMRCHTPHSPSLPHAPEDCSACHRGIANEKAVSHHFSLDCTQCHNVPAEHRVSPQTVRAAKPLGREVCGGCHARGADSPPDIPRIDIVEHGQRYLCWECHYPHSPEAGK